MSRKPTFSDAEFIELFENFGPHETANRTGLAIRGVYSRRSRLEAKLGREILGPNSHMLRNMTRLLRPPRKQYPWQQNLTILDGTLIVGSDFHYWPGDKPLMHRAMVAAIKEYKPLAVIANGDVMDFPTISKHASIGWETRPKVADEIEFAGECLHELKAAAGHARCLWNLGNHDERFETRIANLAPELAKVKGVHLYDHFPLWECAWETWANDELVVMHRFKGGVNAVRNNTIYAGKSITTGHLHNAQVQPFDDLNGTRFGTDSGCVADADGKQFVNYTRAAPKNWRSAFVIHTFAEGRMLQPELVLRWDDKRVQFRGVIFAP